MYAENTNHADTQDTIIALNISIQEMRKEVKKIMKNLMTKIGVVSGVAAASLMAAGSAFAAAPAADTTVTGNVTDLLSGMNTAGLSALGVAVTAGGVLIVTGALVFFGIKHFRAIAHI